MKKCSTLEEFYNTLDNYKTSDADISIKEKAIFLLYELNEDLLSLRHTPIIYSIDSGDLED